MDLSYGILLCLFNFFCLFFFRLLLQKHGQEEWSAFLLLALCCVRTVLILFVAQGKVLILLPALCCTPFLELRLLSLLVLTPVVCMLVYATVSMSSKCAKPRPSSYSLKMK
uniref:Uncharacterized protein n=1 Tax=Opuntia streptacantha TaxID=393608 RepID=A0A7C9DUZ3_OPUST